jgi:hypothetical protein
MEFGRLLARIALDQCGQPFRIVFTSDEGIEHGAAAAAEHVGQHAAEPKIGIIGDFLNVQAVLGDLAHLLFTRTGEVAQFLLQQVSVLWV